MNEQDKAAFDKWLISNNRYDIRDSYDKETLKICWQAALEYDRKRRSPLDALSLYDKLERERARSEKLIQALEELRLAIWHHTNVSKHCEEALEKYRGIK